MPLQPGITTRAGAWELLEWKNTQPLLNCSAFFSHYPKAVQVKGVDGPMLRTTLQNLNKAFQYFFFVTLMTMELIWFAQTQGFNPY
jgi:hypothetical protein